MHGSTYMVCMVSSDDILARVYQIICLHMLIYRIIDLYYYYFMQSGWVIHDEIFFGIYFYCVCLEIKLFFEGFWI